MADYLIKHEESGNLYKYTKLYSHAEPSLTEGDVFRVVIPLKSNTLASANEANVKPIDANHDANCEANEDYVLPLLKPQKV